MIAVLIIQILFSNFINSSEIDTKTLLKNTKHENNNLFNGESVINDLIKKNSSAKEKNKPEVKKTKFSKAPSFLGIGLDPFTLIYNLLTTMRTQENAKSNIYLDVRLKADIDFNRIIFAINAGILKWTVDTEQGSIKYDKITKAFFINPCVYYNFFKKNSWKHALYLGGGINFNGTFYKEIDKNNNEFSKINSFTDDSYWLWFNIDLGNRLKLLNFLYINANFRITFLNFRLKNINNKGREDISTVHNLYGYGYHKKSYNIEFCLNFLFNINLAEDKKVTERESYLYM